MIKYSTGSRRAYARLFRPYNDIEVFIEDVTLEGVYERLVNRALEGKAKVQKVIALGDRATVLKAASNDNGKSPKPRLYIVDGDYELVHKFRYKRVPNLHRLRVYSIENLLAEYGPMIDLANFLFPSKSTSEVRDLIDLDGLRQSVAAHLSSYIQLLAIANLLKIRKPACTIGIPTISVTRNAKYVAPSAPDVRAALRRILNTIIAEKGWPNYRAARFRVRGVIRHKRLEFGQYSPAKKVLLWYFQQRVAAGGGISVNQRLMLSYLADFCEFEHDPDLKKALLSTADKRVRKQK